MSQPVLFRRRRRIKVASVLGGGVVLAASSFLAATDVQAATLTVTGFPGSVPSWASHANDQGAATDDPIVEGEIFLALPNFQAAQAEALAVSTPGSAQFTST